MVYKGVFSNSGLDCSGDRSKETKDFFRFNTRKRKSFFVVYLSALSVVQVVGD